MTLNDIFLGLFDHSHMKYDSDRDTGPDGQPSLSRMVHTALKILQKNRKGYFLMVEGGRIDHAHHENRARYALEETIAFSSAISTTMKMINMEDTLVIGQLLYHITTCTELSEGWCLETACIQYV